MHNSKSFFLQLKSFGGRNVFSKSDSKTVFKNILRKASLRAFLMMGMLIFAQNLIFAQEYDYEQEPESKNILEDFEQNNKPYFDETEQKEFVVLEEVIKHQFNPQLTSISSDNDILCNLYEGLFTAHPITLEPQFAIASDYKISRDKLRWIIKLNEKAAFSNGKPITAYDVKYSWMKLLSTPEAPYASLLDIIRGAADYRSGKAKAEDVGIYVKDEHTISIYLNSPANYLPRVLCHTAFSIMSRDMENVAEDENITVDENVAESKNKTDKSKITDNGIFSGAYVIAEATDNKTVLKKNPYYWDAKNVAIEKVIFLQSDNSSERAYMYNTGKADWVMGNVLADEIIDPDAIQLDPTFGISFYFFKQSVNNPLKKKTGSLWDYSEFRNAVLEAIPWETLRENNFVPATTFVYPLSGYPEVDGFDFTDPMEASIKMQAARRKYKISAEEIIPLTIDIVQDSLPQNIKDAVTLALAPIGVKVIFREIHPALYFYNISKSDADMFTYSWIGDFADPLTFLELFRGNSSFNESGWQNDEYDALLDLASLVSENERYKYLSDAENILLNDGMIIPVARTVSFNIIDPKEVGGWYPNAFDQHLFKYIYMKKQKIDIPNLVMR